MALDAALGRLGIRPGVCTSSTRPANPFEGQVIYETDTNNIRFWSGSAWESNKGGIVSSSAPTGAAAGDIWYDSDDGRTYIYYDDGSSQQWVEFGAAPSGSSITLASYADSAARTSAIPSPTEADLSYLQDTNSVEVYDGSAWAAVGGKILQVVSTTKTDTFTAATDNDGTPNAQWASVTGLTATITPTSATSKVLVLVELSVGYLMSYRITRGGTAIGVGAAAGSRQQATSGGGKDNTYYLENVSGVYLDSPATTSATTYGVDIANNSSTATTITLYINRMQNDFDNTATSRGISTITLMEVSA
jgi:hypothetical protein